ncbi:MAG: hypothetical protein Q8P16_01080, partial [bacterium]|nr:hypothetical protein [bacterium]
MSFLKNLFHCETKRAESVVFIDIAADSVGGAYAHFERGLPVGPQGETPTLVYAQRLPIKVRKDEPHERALTRALEELGNDLIREGAPALMRATGSGSAETILVSVDTPWQETKVRIENFERAKPFIFTKSIVATAMEKTSTVPHGKLLADESIIGTILNGYETSEPYGKKVHRASVIILTSLIDKTISEDIAETLGNLFHTTNILSIAGSSLRYQAMRAAFPHERDALILDAIGPLLSVALVRKDLLVAVIDVASATTADVGSWVQKVIDEFTELAKDHPLPRTIFLLAQEKDVSSLEQTLNETNLGGLWLSDNPPKIVPVRAGHITNFIKQVTTA